MSSISKLIGAVSMAAMLSGNVLAEATVDISGRITQSGSAAVYTKSADVVSSGRGGVAVSAVAKAEAVPFSKTARNVNSAGRN
jgi:hypothetical protein